MSLSVAFPVAFVHSLSEATSSEEVVKICANQLPSVLDVDMVGVTLADGSELVLTAISDEGAVSPGYRIDFGTSLTGRAMKTRKPLIVRAPDAMGSAIIETLFRQGYQTVLVAPMMSNGMLLGSFNTVSYKADAFGPDEQLRIVAVGHWIGSQLLIRKFPPIWNAWQWSIR